MLSYILALVQKELSEGPPAWDTTPEAWHHGPQGSSRYRLSYHPIDDTLREKQEWGQQFFYVRRLPRIIASENGHKK